MMELKKCPFCGSELKIVPDNSGFGPVDQPCFRSHDVDCMNPDCIFMLMFSDKEYTPKQAVEFINHRPIEDDLQRQLASKAAEIERLKEKLNNPTPYCPCPELADKEAEIERLKESNKVGFQRYLQRQIEWSRKTFGDGTRTAGICKHIQKELLEICEAPDDLMEWIDVVILALDGAWRAGYTCVDIVDALDRKQEINKARQWGPDNGDGEPIEHIRESEGE